MSRNQEENSTEEVQQSPIPNLQIQAILGEVRRIMRAENEQLHERMDRLELENRRQRNSPVRPPPRRMQQREQWGDVEEEEEELEELNEPPLNRGRFRRGNGNREVRNWEDNNLGSIKFRFRCSKEKLIRKPILSGKRRWS